MSSPARTSYDEVPYESYPFAQTHPDRLATIATLLGLHPAPVERCRVLELGCAAGGNLIPMALTLPESQFVGIDLSERQIRDGQDIIIKLGLANIELMPLSILDYASFGRFDYLICHGVYSWVPAAVQEKILHIAATHLAPHGVAYVSYNTYPGWHMRGMIRDMMAYHARHFTDPLVRVKQARNLLDFLARTAAGQETPYGLLLQREVEAVRRSRDSYLFHEHLEEVNDPIYFHQFAERAATQGLRYLGEADLSVMVPGNYPPEVENVLQMLSPDLIHMEQYMDFLRNRMFRQTLLCHKSVTPNYALRPEQLTAFHVGSPARPVSEKPDLASNEFEKFEGRDGVTLNSRDPLMKSAMMHLSEAWPRCVPFEELRSAARARLSPGTKPDAETIRQDTQQLGQGLMSCYTSAATNLVELHLDPPRFAWEVSARPVASPLARLQAERSGAVTNLRHELVHLADFDRHLLRHLDGRHDRVGLVDALEGLAVKGELRVQEDGQPVTDRARARQCLEKGRDQQLPELVRNALVIR